MKFEQHINWTVLPAGLSDDGTQARVSVFIAPRLQALPGNGAPAGNGPPAESGTGPLAQPPTLEQFPDFLTWPEKIKTATFEFGTTDGSSASSVSFVGPLVPQGPAPDTDLWTNLFNKNTPLEPYVFLDHGQRTFRTYSATEVRDFTRNTYAKAARTSPESPPVTRDVLRAVTDTGAGTEHVATATDGTTPDDGEMPPELVPLNEFHARKSAPELADVQPPPPPPPELPRPDFHQMLTSLGDHPQLLRRLGLVLDILLPADRLPVSSGERFLTVTSHWKPALGDDSHDVSPRTRYVFLPDRRAFVPGAQSLTADEPLAPPSRGLVALQGNFHIEQADIDGAALKLSPVPSDAKGLSPVRTYGISLVREGRLGSLREEFDRAAQHEGDFTRALARDGAAVQVPDPPSPAAAAPDTQGAPSPPELVAEDLVRGHRLDVWDKDQGRWLSLHERDVEYRQPNDGPVLLSVSDEGFFQANLASPPPEAQDTTLYVPEQLVTWEGWSLSAPHLGLVLDIDEGSVEDDRPPNRPVEVSNRAKTALPLEITAKVRPGSLPRLRFGHEYRVRLRTVDLAGNGLGPAEADALMGDKGLALPGGDGGQVFQRFEPVLAPAVAPRLPFGEGASAFRLVIRSSPGDRPPAAGPAGNVVRVALANVQFGKANEDVRVVQQALINRGHQLVGGADGVFGPQTKAAYAEEQRAQGFSGDDADGNPGCTSLTKLGSESGFTVDCGDGGGPPPGVTAEQYAANFNSSPLVTEEGHVPYQGVDERHVVAPKASLRCVEWHGRLDGAIGSTDQGAQDEVYELAKRESGSLNDPSQPDVRLMPIDSPATDPRNPAVTALHTGESIELPYLPDPLATAAVFLDLPGMPAGQPFTVPWGGEVWHRPRSFRLRLAEGTAPPDFDEASRVLTVSLPKGAVATVRLCSGIDFHEKNLGMASWCRDALESTPQLATGADATARTAEELQRTERALELAAAGRHWMFTPWQELTLVHAVQRPLRTPVLDLSALGTPRGRDETAEHLAGEIALDEASTDRIELVAEWTEVTDAGPTGRDAQEMTVPVFGLLTPRVDRQGVPGTDPAVLQNGTLTFSTKAAEDKSKANQGKIPPVPEKHEFGDTKHRMVSYRPVAGSKFSDYFPPRFAEPGQNALTVQGDAKEHSVPSSAPPTAPRLLYCVPTLALETLDGPPGAIVQRRRGSGIRVYLDRPWYSSGDGELLGVVLGEPPGGDPNSTRDAWVTLMGRDPIHRSASVVAPTPEVFTNAVRRSGKLTLSTPSGPLSVTVVGYTPQFERDDENEKGGRWFCDLDLNTGDACLPFVRLALVRFQPDSIPGAEKSPVVLADLVRTLPDRELTVRPGEVLSVSVTGPSWDPTGSSPPHITATLQRRHDVVTDKDLGWVTLGDTAVALKSVDAESSRRPFYTGQVPVPPGLRGVPLRLLVVETEDLPDGSPTAATAPGPVVYCDAVDLPPLQDGPGGGPHDGHDGHDGHDDGHDGDDDHDGHDGNGGHDDHDGHHGAGGHDDHHG
ncbi:peptidoglycan-binding protein [Streptomyces abikoensis]|uniref:peptidoglycan-binding domain-containing protein n=1 Tax=Streptomyces abikoensis TaxID=97398 RepID=UPI00368AF70C